ncbi:hypothetical protein [Streptomyces sp. NPDC014676]|uniref:terpene synthase family protein n=1 Tax=Streptomyces sp. NPDC014676 TaxID=3364879 RepID=UPI0036F5D560
MPDQHRKRRIPLPFRIRGHPDEEAIQRSGEQWAAQYGLLTDARALDRFRRHRITGLMTAGCAAADVDMASLVVEVATLAFFLDDQQNNAARTDRAAAYDSLNARLRAVILGADVGAEDNPLVRALADVLERLGVRASAGWQARFRHDLLIAFQGHEAENVFRRNADVPAADGFPSMRREASFCYPLLDVLELCQEIWTYYQALVTVEGDRMTFSSVEHGYRPIPVGSSDGFVYAVRVSGDNSVPELTCEACA